MTPAVRLAASLYGLLARLPQEESVWTRLSYPLSLMIWV